MRSSVLPARPFQKNRIAAQVRNINMILLVSVLVLISGVAAFIIRGVSSDASKNLARSYSVEAANKFIAYISQDLNLVKKVSRSRAVTGWFADEENQEKRINAYHEMTDYADLWQDAKLYLGISGSMNGFSITGDTLAGDVHVDYFTPGAVLSRSNINDSWYFETIESRNEYTLKIDIDRFSGGWRLWISHKVFSNGKIYGVFCAGFNIERIIRDMFAQYDSSNVRGYVIDEFGRIRMDSANYSLFGELFGKDIRTTHPDSAFDSALNSFLDNTDGYYGADVKPVVLELNKGEYKFVSIVPITGTIWTVVTFFNSGSLFSVRNFLPLLIAMLSAFIVYTVAGNVLMSRFVTTPLNLLTKSLSETESGSGNVYGQDMDNEIGELARTTRNMRDSLSAYNSDLLRTIGERDRRDQLLHSVNKIAAALLSSADGEKFEESFLAGIEHIALCMDIDRVYIWRNELRDGVMYYDQIFEWLTDLGHRKDHVPTSVCFPYSDVPEWEESFLKGECVNGPLSTMSENIKRRLKSWGVQSLLMIPVYLYENFWGFISFDDCHQERFFADDEIDIMRSTSLMMVNAINRNEQNARIRDAHELTQRMMDATPLACSLWNKDFKTTFANEETCRLLDIKTKQEVIDRHYEFFPEYQPDGQLSREKAAVHIQKAFDDGKCVLEWCYQKLDGTLIPVEVTLVRVKYSGEDRVAGYARDIRQYKRMMEEIEQRDFMLQTVNQAAAILLQSDINKFEENLRRSIGMMAQVASADRVQIWKNTAKDGRFYCSQIYEWNHGAESRQGIRDAAEISLDEFLPNWKEKLENGYCINSKVHDLSAEEQANLFTRGALSVLAVPVLLQDQFWGFIVFDDIRRERVFSENEESILRSASLLVANALIRNEMTLDIQAAAARLEGVMNNYAGIIWSVDQNNIITLFKGLYLNVIGVNPSFFEGKSLDAALLKNRHLDIIERTDKTFREGPQDWISNLDDKKFRIKTMPIYDEKGLVTSVVGSVDDITDMIRLQTELEEAVKKAEAASRAKSNFLSNMSHEIRTPMNAIIGMTKIGKSAQDSGKKDYAFEKIDGASNHLLGIINDILEMSKIEAGKFDLSYVEFDFEKMLQKVVNVISFRIEEKRQKFTVHFDREIPHCLIGDDQRLAQVITNLLSNAVKFTPEEESIRLDAYLEKEEDGIYTLRIEVKDNGIGISLEQQARLFSSFEQAESSTSRKFGGTGLGLSISKHIVELMGGKIWIESELGKGALFAFTVSFRAGEDHKDSMLPGVDWSNLRMLAVDDDPEILEFFAGVAEQHKINCDTASGAAKALDLIKSHPYDILFIDWKMPGMDGIELSREIQARGSGNSVVVMISATEWNVIEKEAKASGVNDYMSKPLFPSSIMDKLKKYVGVTETLAPGNETSEITESFTGFRVLLVEDVEINREIVLTMLEPLQLKIDCAVNGKEAVTMFATGSYDLIFMDLQMPEMDGFEATRLIRGLPVPGAMEIPIIAMTANVFREDIEKCLAAGMNDHVGKPIDFGEVVEKLRFFLKKG